MRARPKRGPWSQNLDENAGRLLAHLKKTGVDENTILIFMSDNGPIPARFNSGMRGLKGTVYEGGIRVPFFVRWPAAVKAGVKIDRLAAHIDVFPTLLEACDVRQPAGGPISARIDGVSLCALLRDPQTAWPDRTIYFQWHRGDRGELYRNCAARNQRYKLVNGKELYDLQEDPAEAHDIAAAEPERVAQLRAGYDNWFHDVAATRNFEPPRIWLGAPVEPLVLLTRQDWRGPNASWEPGGLGHWQVDVRSAGTYECTLLFPAFEADGRVRLSLGGIKAEAAAVHGDTKATLRLSGVPAGLSRVEAEIASGAGQPVGPRYVAVNKLAAS